MRRLLHRGARLRLGQQGGDRALAAQVGLDVDDFESKYVRRVGIRKSLIEYANGDCVFFDGQTRNCTVYEARPRQCRTWPFWDSNIDARGTGSEPARSAPAAARERSYSVEQILEQVSVMKLLAALRPTRQSASTTASQLALRR